MKTVRLTLRVDVDDDVRARDVKEYVEDAVGSWCGQFHPEDERRYYGDDIKVSFYRTPVVGTREKAGD